MKPEHYQDEEDPLATARGFFNAFLFTAFAASFAAGLYLIL